MTTYRSSKYGCLFFGLCCLVFLGGAAFAQTGAQPISLDEFLSASEIGAARISPDGQSAVIETHAPDWEH